MDELVRYPRFRWLVLLAACISNAALNLNMVSYAPILNEIAKSLNTDVGTATNLMAVFPFAGAVSFLVGGVLCDRFGIFFALILGNLCGSVPALLMPWIGTSYGTVLFARVVEGTAVGFCMSAMSPIMAVWFPVKERGIAGGLLGTSVALGAAIGFPVAPAVCASTGSWQQMSSWLSLVGWIAFALAFVLALSPKPMLPSGTGKAARPEGQNGLFRHALASPITWIAVFVTFFAAWLMQTIYNITPTYLAVDKPLGVGYGPAAAGKLMIGVSLAGIFAPIIAGIIQDKVFRGNPRPFMFIGFILAAAFILLILAPAVYGNPPLLVACIVLASSGISIVYPAITVFISITYPMQIVGKMLGICMGLGSFGGAAGLFAAGLCVARFGNYEGAISLITLAGVVGFVFAVFLKRPEQTNGK